MGYASPPNRDEFFATVWEIVRQVPPGKVCTYGQIAAMIPPPGGMSLKDYEAFAARWVGSAMANCPDDVPWQRVINSQGKISLDPGGSRQRALLEAEGIEFDEHDRVDLKRFRWEGPPDEWLKARNLWLPPERTQPKQGMLGI